MKKVILGLSVLSGLLFASCDKEVNVAKGYAYTIDEEFLNNDREWLQKDEERVQFSVNTEENGLLVIQSQSSKSSNKYQDHKAGDISSDGNFIIESSFTYPKDSLGLYTSKLSNSSGINWGISSSETSIPLMNYFHFGVALDTSNFSSIVKVSQFVGGKETALLEGVSIGVVDPPVFNLSVEQLDTAWVFKANGSTVGSISKEELYGGDVGVNVDTKTNTNFHNLRVQVQ
jgi:hypothetical protein